MRSAKASKSFSPKTQAKNDSSIYLETFVKENERVAIQNDVSSKDYEEVFNEGRWADDENERFLQALRKHGKSWNQVSAVVGTRSSSQTRSHAQKFFRKL